VTIIILVIGCFSNCFKLKLTIPIYFRKTTIVFSLNEQAAFFLNIKVKTSCLTYIRLSTLSLSYVRCLNSLFFLDRLGFMNYIPRQTDLMFILTTIESLGLSQESPRNFEII